MKCRLLPRTNWPCYISQKAEQKSTYRGQAIRLYFSLADDYGFVDDCTFLSRAGKLNLGVASPQEWLDWFTGRVCH